MKSLTGKSAYEILKEKIEMAQEEKASGKNSRNKKQRGRRSSRREKSTVEKSLDEHYNPPNWEDSRKGNLPEDCLVHWELERPVAGRGSRVGFELQKQMQLQNALL